MIMLEILAHRFNPVARAQIALTSIIRSHTNLIITSLAKFKLLAQFIVALVTWGAINACSAAEPVVINLWRDKIPDEPPPGVIGPERVRMSPGLDRTQVEVTNKTRMITGVTQPTITIYSAPAEKNTGAAMLIFPGGGYWDLYWELEGEEVAQWLNSIGVTGIILKYRVPRRPGEPEREPARRPLQDAQRAIRLVRERAAEFKIATNKIGVVGFSAGGHLAIAAATKFSDKTYEPQDDIDRSSCRPDFGVSVYPGYLKDKMKPELAQSISVPTNAPPVFLVHGDADLVSPPEGSVLSREESLKRVCQNPEKGEITLAATRPRKGRGSPRSSLKSDRSTCRAACRSSTRSQRCNKDAAQGPSRPLDVPRGR
jgi:acetyl esterase/lipase